MSARCIEIRNTLTCQRFQSLIHLNVARKSYSLFEGLLLVFPFLKYLEKCIRNIVVVQSAQTHQKRLEGLPWLDRSAY